MKCLRCREDKNRTDFGFKDKRWNVRRPVCLECENKSSPQGGEPLIVLPIITSFTLPPESKEEVGEA